MKAIFMGSLLIFAIGFVTAGAAPSSQLFIVDRARTGLGQLACLLVVACKIIAKDIL
jgi:hypothetical protein